MLNRKAPNPKTIATAAVEFSHEFNLANPFPTARSIIDTSDHSEDRQDHQITCFVDAGCFEGGFTCWEFCVVDSARDVLHSACTKELKHWV